MEQQFYLPNRKEYLSESVAEHRAIIQAISEGNGQGAAELMHNHFARYGERENG
jgi:DNA-binding GntR family transcriptional regulator